MPQTSDEIEKERLAFIESVDPEALKLIQKTYETHGSEVAQIHIAAWFEAWKAVNGPHYPRGVRRV